MRPKPLIATRIAILSPLEPIHRITKNRHGRACPGHPSAAYPSGEWSSLSSGWPASAGHDNSIVQRRARGLCRSFGRDRKVLVHILIGPAGPEAMHSDKTAMRADVTVPPFAHGSFDGDFNGAFAQNP